MDAESAEDIARRARIRYESLMAKRERAEALRRELTSLKVDLRIFAGHVATQTDAFNRRVALLASRISAHLDELAQEETSIVGLPALEPKDPRQQTTRRTERPG